MDVEDSGETEYANATGSGIGGIGGVCSVACLEDDLAVVSK